MKYGIFLLPLILFLQGCNQSKADSPIEKEVLQEGISYQILHEGSDSSYPHPRSKSATILRDLNSYEDELYKRSNEYQKPVDFDTHTVLLIDMGPKNTGGYTLRIESLLTENDYVRAHVVFTVPGDTCVVATALTNPYKFIEVATTKDILVTEDVEVSDCESQ